ncbi:MAG: carbohydrate-binding protein [Verrucomicrobiota bacterium]
MKRILLICLLACCFAHHSSKAAEHQIVIQPENRQKITHWGIVARNRPDWGKPWDILQHPKSMKAIYHELGASIARIYIDEEVFDNEQRRDELKNNILGATEHGLKWYGVPWTPPVHMKTIEHPNGRVKGEKNYLKEGFEDDVAQWLTDLVVWLKENGVPEPVALGVQNEPDWPPPGYDGCLYTPEQLRKTGILLRKALDKAGLSRVKVTLTEGAFQHRRADTKENLQRGTFNMLGLDAGGAFETDEELRNAISIISTHTYDIHSNIYKKSPSILQSYFEATKQGIAKEKESWMTEWEARHEHVHNDWEIISETVAHFNRDLSSLEFNAWFQWHVWDGRPVGSIDEGDCVWKLCPGNTLVYEQVDFGSEARQIEFRVAAKDGKASIELRIGAENGRLIGVFDLPKTWNLKHFETVICSIEEVSGIHDLYLKVVSDEHWRESSMNWFQIEGGSKIEAETFTRKQTEKSWQGSIKSCYDMNTRCHFVYETDRDMVRRPLFYIFKKIYNSAPADGNTFMRIMKSTDPEIQGESKEPNAKSFRQDLCAFVNNGKMTVTILNRNAEDKVLDVQGLTGSKVKLFRYERADAISNNVDMKEVGSLSIEEGSLADIEFPAESITILLTE